MMDFIKIPEQRKGVLIGKEGNVKKMLEERTKTLITIDDDVRIEGEPLDVMNSKEVVKAIGRGFSPDKALKLLDEEYQLVVVKVEGSDKCVKRMLSRVIGKRGLCKKKIENYTKTEISVYGKTVSIIGRWSDVERANDAVDLILEGKPHSYVYRVLMGGK